METIKAGCILLDAKSKSAILCYRKYLNDYTFPKGHLEEGESIEECAIRETAEETKRIAQIVPTIKPYILLYTTPSNEICKCYMYVAIDIGKSDNDSEDTHPTLHVPINEVEKKLSYNNLKQMWTDLLPQITSIVK